jgi:hypothetical protein
MSVSSFKTDRNVMLPAVFPTDDTFTSLQDVMKTSLVVDAIVNPFATILEYRWHHFEFQCGEGWTKIGSMSKPGATVAMKRAVL